MYPIVEEQHVEEFLMDIFANNNGSNIPANEQDRRDDDSYLNMSRDGIDGEEQPIAETSINGKQSDI
jgi:hypothetical protein